MSGVDSYDIFFSRYGRSFVRAALLLTGIPVFILTIRLLMEGMMFLVFADLRHDRFFVSTVEQSLSRTSTLLPFCYALVFYGALNYLNNRAIRMLLGGTAFVGMVYCGWLFLAVITRFTGILTELPGRFLMLILIGMILTGFASLVWSAMRLVPRKTVDIPWGVI